MAKNTKPDMSCARVKQYQSSDIGLCERHNERKNESYNNINVVSECIDMNIHYKSPDGKSYMDILRQIETDGKVSTRGLRQDATLFDEIIIDVNTIHFERKGGYEYAKEFYAEAYRFDVKLPNFVERSKQLSIRSATQRSGHLIFSLLMITEMSFYARTENQSIVLHTASCKTNCLSI